MKSINNYINEALIKKDTKLSRINLIKGTEADIVNYYSSLLKSQKIIPESYGYDEDDNHNKISLHFNIYSTRIGFNTIDELIDWCDENEFKIEDNFRVYKIIIPEKNHYKII